MKRLTIVISSLLILPAFAEVTPRYYADVPEYSDADIIETDAADFVSSDTENYSEDMSEQQTAPVPAPNAGATSSYQSGRTTSSRAVASGTRASRMNVTNGNSGATVRNVTGRGTGTNGATVARGASRATATRAGAAYAPAAGGSVATPTRSVNTQTARGTGTSNGSVARATTASIVQTNTATKPLYNSSRVSSRVPTIRMATANMTATTSGASTSTAAAPTATAADKVAEMDELAQMTDYCKAQYTQCMDNFCNVLDDNQGRCSCSKNVTNYAKTESALKSATEELQNVAQKIQYIGLSGKDIETLFSQTEAELKMTTTTDNTQLKNDLDKIKNMIVGVKTSSATSTETGINLDLSGLLDFSVSSTGFDLASLFGGNRSATSISNQRGEQLYKTAAARCKAAVLNTCASQGVDTNVISNSYDLEIDKQCILYERSLTDANEEMLSTVRNAKNVLQKARLLVEQNKNQYDLRGCVNALDSCMQDDFVCGSDYENCLDPTGKYIVNGAVVVGAEPGVPGGAVLSTETTATGLYATWNYGTGSTASTAFGAGNVPDYVNASLFANTDKFKSNATNMAEFLQKKIGYADKDGNSFGMCMSVLNKCQDLTYSCGGNQKNCNPSKKTYDPSNEVVRTYLERVSLQIKTAQDTLLSNYAENCISDVSSCLSSNTYSQLTSLSGATTGTVSAVAVSACRAPITSCMSATGYDTSLQSKIYSWLTSTLGVTVSGGYVSEISEIETPEACVALHGKWTSGTPKGSCDCADANTMKWDGNVGMCVCKEATKEWNAQQQKCVAPASGGGA